MHCDSLLSERLCLVEIKRTVRKRRIRELWSKSDSCCIVTGSLVSNRNGNACRECSRSRTGYKHDCIAERRTGNCLPDIVEVVPVHTGCNVLLRELVIVVVELEPFTINKHCLDICHKSKLVCCYLFDLVRVGNNLTESLVIKCSPVINQFKTSHEVCLIHIERGSKYVDIVLCVVLCIHENILIGLRRSSVYSCYVIFGAHEL